MHNKIQFNLLLKTHYYVWNLKIYLVQYLVLSRPTFSHLWEGSRFDPFLSSLWLSFDPRAFGSFVVRLGSNEEIGFDQECVVKNIKILERACITVATSSTKISNPLKLFLGLYYEICWPTFWTLILTDMYFLNVIQIVAT